MMDRGGDFADCTAVAGGGVEAETHLLTRAAGELQRARESAEAEILQVAERLARLSFAPDEPVLPGGSRGVLYGGEGTCLVDEFVECELAAAMGVSERYAANLLADAIELVQRLPRVWMRVLEGEVPVWRARRIATATSCLSPVAADLADARLAEIAERVGVTVLARMVAAVAIEHGEVDRLPVAAAKPTVDVVHAEGTGRARIAIETDAHSAMLFDQMVGQLAEKLRRLGDESELQERRSKAIGVIATPARALAVLGMEPDGDAARHEMPEDLGDPLARVDPALMPQIMLHVHVVGEAMTGEAMASDAMAGAARTSATPAGDVPAEDVSTSAVAHGAMPVPRAMSLRADHRGERVARCGGFGPVGLSQVREWIGHSRVVVKPVVDVAGVPAVDAYEVPARMRAAVVARHAHCVFPWCQRPADQCQLDHIVPFDHDAFGSRAQTCLENLAPLCQRHHRAKTHAGWSYRRLGPNTYLWSSPEGQAIVTGPEGTFRIGTVAELAMASGRADVSVARQSGGVEGVSAGLALRLSDFQHELSTVLDLLDRTTAAIRDPAPRPNGRRAQGRRAQARSSQVRSSQVRSSQVRSTQIRGTQVATAPALGTSGSRRRSRAARESSPGASESTSDPPPF